MRKLKRLLKKRGITVKSSGKLYRQLVKDRNCVVNSTTMGWFSRDTPDVIFITRKFGLYKSPDPISVILHEYRHWVQLKRKPSIWDTYRAAEFDADKFAERARNRF